jgi:hypothetical protein
MPNHRPCRRLFVLAAILSLAAITAGCGQSKPSLQAPAQTEQQHTTSVQEASTPSQEDAPTPTPDESTCRDERSIEESERNRAACFHLRPGVTTTKVVKVPAKSAKTTKSTTKKGQKAAAPKAAIQKTKVVQTTGRCQPQSLIYARCRTGFMTCRLGDTSPVQWFACAKKNHSTSATPVTGSVIVLDVNTRRGMPTGHPAYVEAVKKNQDGTWTLRISHTNYDRKCHLDLDATVLFDPKRMTASFTTGPWGPWAKDLKALGFILR